MARKLNNKADQELISSGKSALQRDYYGDIESFAREILDNAENEYDDYGDARESIDERIHETADGTSWVIYTANALDVLVASRNWLAVEDAGLDVSSEDLTQMITQAAYFAVRQDLFDAVEQWEEEYWKKEDEEENPRRNNPTPDIKKVRSKLLR